MQCCTACRGNAAIHRQVDAGEAVEENRDGERGSATAEHARAPDKAQVDDTLNDPDAVTSAVLHTTLRDKLVLHSTPRQSLVVLHSTPRSNAVLGQHASRQGGAAQHSSSVTGGAAQQAHMS